MGAPAPYTGTKGDVHAEVLDGRAPFDETTMLDDHGSAEAGEAPLATGPGGVRDQEREPVLV